MRIVMYKNRNAIFDFVLQDVIDRLKYYSDWAGFASIQTSVSHAQSKYNSQVNLATVLLAPVPFKFL